MAKVLFYTATVAQFAALQSKDENALYFLTDTGEFYKGATRFSFPVQQVADFPANGETGILYVKSDGEAKIWTGSSYVTIGGNQTDSFLQSVERHEVTSAEAGKGVYADAAAGDVGICFTMSTGEQTFIKLTEFIDTYTADNTSAKGVEVSVSGYKISAEAKVSSATGNRLELKTDGLYIPALEWQTIN